MPRGSHRKSRKNNSGGKGRQKATRTASFRNTSKGKALSRNEMRRNKKTYPRLWTPEYDHDQTPEVIWYYHPTKRESLLETYDEAYERIEKQSIEVHRKVGLQNTLNANRINADNKNAEVITRPVEIKDYTQTSTETIKTEEPSETTSMQVICGAFGIGDKLPTSVHDLIQNDRLSNSNGDISNGTINQNHLDRIRSRGKGGQLNVTESFFIANSVTLRMTVGMEIVPATISASKKHGFTNLSHETVKNWIKKYNLRERNSSPAYRNTVTDSMKKDIAKDYMNLFALYGLTVSASARIVNYKFGTDYVGETMKKWHDIAFGNSCELHGESQVKTTVKELECEYGWKAKTFTGLAEHRQKNWCGKGQVEKTIESTIEEKEQEPTVTTNNTNSTGIDEEFQNQARAMVDELINKIIEGTWNASSEHLTKLMRERIKELTLGNFEEINTSFELVKEQAEESIEAKYRNKISDLEKEVSRMKGDKNTQGSIMYWRHEASVNETGRNRAEKTLREERASHNTELLMKDKEREELQKENTALLMKGSPFNRMADALNSSTDRASNE